MEKILDATGLAKRDFERSAFTPILEEALLSSQLVQAVVFLDQEGECIDCAARDDFYWARVVGAQAQAWAAYPWTRNYCASNLLSHVHVELDQGVIDIVRLRPDLSIVLWSTSTPDFFDFALVRLIDEVAREAQIEVPPQSCFFQTCHVTTQHLPIVGTIPRTLRVGDQTLSLELALSWTGGAAQTSDWKGPALNGRFLATSSRGAVEIVRSGSVYCYRPLAPRRFSLLVEEFASHPDAMNTLSPLLEEAPLK